jgi:hypothetical protein
VSWRESAVEVQMDCRYGGYLHNGGHESTRQCGTVLPREIATKTAISAISSRVCLRMAQFGQRASRLWPNAGVDLLSMWDCRRPASSCRGQSPFGLGRAEGLGVPACDVDEPSVGHQTRCTPAQHAPWCAVCVGGWVRWSTGGFVVQTAGRRLAGGPNR